MQRPKRKEIIEMLKQSNLIEREPSPEALEDAITAWDWAWKNRDSISVNYILTIHRKLCQRIAPKIAGNIRDCDVYIGGRRKWFISEALIKEDLKRNVILMCNGLLAAKDPSMTKEDAEVFCKNCHIDFENIHPFVDFNGRTGRILYNIHRLKLGLPLHIIHADWPDENGEQMNYYKWFRE